MSESSLNKIGYGSLRGGLVDPALLSRFELARVMTVNRDSFLVSNGEREMIAEITGRLRVTAAGPEALPTVGDWVYAQLFDDGDLAIIHQVAERMSVLKRKRPGRNVEYQAIGANIDMAFIMQGLDANFNIRRLERYLAMVYDAGIAPLVLLSKCDLVSADELSEKLAEIARLMPELECLPFSNISGDGLRAVQARMQAGRTYCLIGSSGVGKTTLLNVLLESEVFETGAVRQKDQRGRHTTSRRQLTILANGALLIDTPGMRELGNIGISDGIAAAFEEISSLTASCKFNDCTHTSEKGCAILAALEGGEIEPERYESYMKLQRESRFNEMTLAERRKRDKEFGRMIKSVLKHSVKK